MEPEDSIIVSNVSKRFRVFHERTDTVYGYLTTIFNRKKSYDMLDVLKNISFSVKKGEMLGIIGLNGSGKTSLLKIIGKIYSTDEGTIITRGKVTPFLELGTGFNGELTARDNVIMYGVILGFTKKEIMTKIEKIAKFAEVERFLDTKLKNFSSGMNARLAFATAVEVDPDIMLVDEVLAVGDISFREKSFNAFMDFKKRGKTIVFVSHDVNQVMKQCDKVLWLNEGSIRAYGAPNEVVKQYTEFASKK